MDQEKEIVVKVHESYRWVVAVCDKELLGTILQDGKRKLDLTGQFFDGELMNKEGVKRELERCDNEDATFNIVGEKSVKIALEAGLIEEEGIAYIGKVPFALVLM